jgi:flagellar protein FliS
MRARAANAYASTQLQTGVASSSPGHLIILIYERIFDHLKVGNLIQQGLLACLDFEDGGEISQSLAAVYEWSLREIIAARASKSAEKIQGVVDVMTPLYEAWLELAPREMINHLSTDESMADSNPERRVANL